MVWDYLHKHNQIYKVHFATLLANWFEFLKKNFLGFCPGLSTHPKECPLNVCYAHKIFIYANANPTNAICGP